MFYNMVLLLETNECKIIISVVLHIVKKIELFVLLRLSEHTNNGFSELSMT
jgi:hypothetical protein